MLFNLRSPLGEVLSVFGRQTCLILELERRRPNN